ncbi:MAG: NHL repeat-containing protein [Candidatus Wallbacteria bacterium]|nr:NHL repeat-containing protein [Candidatus Wallbacteria bacterium]
MTSLKRLALVVLAGLSWAADAPARETAFVSLEQFSARATTRAATFSFRSPAFGVARVELALPVDAGSPRKQRHTRHVKPGAATLTVPTDCPPGQLEYSVEVELPAYSAGRSLGRFGRGEGQFVKPTHIALSPRGEAYVVDTGSDRVQVFDRHLDFLFQFGHFNPGPASAGAEVELGRFDEPWDLVINGYQEIFITDQNNRRVVRYDMLGRVIAELGRDAGLAVPRGIASDIDRELYVCDSDNDRVLVFDRDGRVRRKIGAYGWGAQQFKTPTDVAVAPDRTLYVADAGNARVQVFDRFGRPLEILDGPFQAPENLYVDADGFLYVIDSKAAKIFRYTSERVLVATYPGPDDDYAFDTPTDCARAPDGTLYVVDSGHGRVLLLEESRRAFRRSGKLAVEADKPR